MAVARSGAVSVWIAHISSRSMPSSPHRLELVEDPLGPIARIPLGADEVRAVRSSTAALLAVTIKPSAGSSCQGSSSNGM